MFRTGILYMINKLPTPYSITAVLLIYDRLNSRAVDNNLCLSKTAKDHELYISLSVDNIRTAIGGTVRRFLFSSLRDLLLFLSKASTEPNR